MQTKGQSGRLFGLKLRRDLLCEEVASDFQIPPALEPLFERFFLAAGGRLGSFFEGSRHETGEAALKVYWYTLAGIATCT